jgi:hypothetical protein
MPEQDGPPTVACLHRRAFLRPEPRGAAALRQLVGGNGPTARARRSGTFDTQSLTAAATIGKQILSGARVLGDGRAEDRTSGNPLHRDVMRKGLAGRLIRYPISLPRTEKAILTPS